MKLILEKGDSEIEVEVQGTAKNITHLQVGDELLRIVGTK